jgi:exoribonuclease II
VEKGTLVEFRLSGDRQGERRLAVVDRPEGKKHFQLIDINGNSHTVHPREIEYVVPGERLLPHKIPSFKLQLEPFIDPSSLEVAWEILQADQSSTSPSQMAELLFSEVNGVTCYASHILLTEDKLYFKQKGDLFEPRSPAQVAELRHQLEVSQQRAKEIETFRQKLTDRIKDSSLEINWTNSDRQRLECLERYVLQGDDSKDKAAAQELLASLQRPKHDVAAFQLLVDLGLWSLHENIALRRSQIPIKFGTDVIARVTEILENPPSDRMKERIDLTSHHVYTIDDESTSEIDDGLSLEILADGKKRIWIHIADPTRWLEPNDLLDREARKRGTTVYLPTGMIPMFPPELATGQMSLVQGQICNALSFGVDLDPDGKVIDSQICASLIKPRYRLTYEDANEMVQMGVETDLDDLSNLAKLRHHYRLSQGAIHIRLPETTIKVNPKDESQLLVEMIDDSPSRQLVAEMMILTGEVAAKFAQTNNIPVPFRFQSQPELPSEEILMQLPPGPVREFAMVRCMTKGEMGVYPFRHAGLALEAYSQVTSPIRRYGDLMAHFQIKAFLNGDPLPFDHASLTDLFSMTDGAIYEASQIEKQTNRYWSLEYLRRNKDQVWRALLLDWLRQHEQLGLVLLEDLGLKLPIRITRSVNVGESFEVMVEEVDPRRDLINFRELASVMTMSMVPEQVREE